MPLFGLEKNTKNTITLNNKIVKSSNEETVLHIKFDKNLNLDKYISDICQKAQQLKR